jgi:hypothetical protein
MQLLPQQQHQQHQQQPQMLQLLLSQPSGSASQFHSAGGFSKVSSHSKTNQASLIKTSQSNAGNTNKSSANVVNTSLIQSVKKEEEEEKSLCQLSSSTSQSNPAVVFAKGSSSSKTSQTSLIKTSEANIAKTNKSSANVVNSESVKQEEEQRRLLSEPSGSVSPFHPAGVFSKGSLSSKMSQTSLIKKREANIAKTNKSSANFVNTSLNQSVKQEEEQRRLLSEPSGSVSQFHAAGVFSKGSSSSKMSQTSLIKTSEANITKMNKSSANVVNTSLSQSVKQEEEQRRLLSEPSGSVSQFHATGVFAKGSSSSKMSQTSLIKTSQANIAKTNKSSANIVNTSLNQSVKQEEKEKSPVSGLYTSDHRECLSFCARLTFFILILFSSINGTAFFEFSLVSEGTTEKVLQFGMTLKSIFNQNLCFIEQKMNFRTPKRGPNSKKSINRHLFGHENIFLVTFSELSHTGLC